MNIKTTFQITVPRRTNCCCKGQEPLQAGMEYYSMLTGEIEDKQYTRQDYCLNCWNMDGISSTARQGSYWKSVVPTKKASSEIPKQRDARALHLLKENLLCNHDEDAAETFILSLYLARRKRLLFRKEMTTHNGQPGMLYEIPETEEMLLTPKLKLSELEVEKLQLLLAKKFQSL